MVTACGFCVPQPRTPVYTCRLPNNSLKLTRRAGPSGMLESPAGLAYSDGQLGRIRRAAS